MEAYYVYMLRCRGGSLYTGMTNDVARRMAMHCSGRGAEVHPGPPAGGTGGAVALRGQDNGVAAGIRHQGEADPRAEGNACRRAGEDRGVVSRASRRGGNDAARGEGISNFCKSNVSAVTGNDKIGIFSQNALDKPKILAIMKLSAEVPLLLRFNED